MKIDLATIDGYEAMSDAEKISALEAYEYDDHAAEVADIAKYKEATDKATREASEYKKQLKQLQEAQKTGNIKADDTIAQLQKQVADLTRQNTISSYTAQFVALGYDPELAAETAEATADGDVSKVFENQRKFKEALEKQVRSDILKATPKPGALGTGKPAPTMTLEKFKKLSPVERAKFATDYPEEYSKMYGG